MRSIKKNLKLPIRNDFASQFDFEVIENDSFENMIEIVNKSQMYCGSAL